MRRFPWIFILALLLLSLIRANQAFGDSQAAIVAQLVLKVSDRDQAASLLIQRAEDLDGWFSRRSDEMVELKIPAANAESFIGFALEQGILADRSYSSTSYDNQLSLLSASLKSKESLLSDYLEVLKEARQASILAVEQEIVALTEQIEKIKGEIRYLAHNTEYARISITFQFRDRSAPTADGSSSFPWLNTMNLSDLVGDFSR
ncbi:MAG: DUF4349 domain-containing protein [Desulfobulbaceae bacterium]|nr:DUF4349 domain-containing protein [Desulfobulbaceae bacterium]